MISFGGGLSHATDILTLLIDIFAFFFRKSYRHHWNHHKTNSTIGELDQLDPPWQLYHNELLMCWDVIYTLYLRIRRNIEHSLQNVWCSITFTYSRVWISDGETALLPLDVITDMLVYPCQSHSTLFVLSLVSSKRMPAVFLLYGGKMQLYRSGLNLHFAVHSTQSLLRAVCCLWVQTDCFCRAGIKIMKTKKHTHTKNGF